MANVNANVNVLVNTQQAQAQIAALQGKINAFNKGVVASSGAAVAQQAAMNKALMDGAVASKMFTARMIPVTTSVDTFTKSLEKNKFSLGQYTRYAASQLPGMSRVFRKEFDTINRVAESNVRRLQTQFTAAGTAANGMNRAIALTPTSLNGMAASQAIANQRAMIFNKLMRDGSTSLLNWGKNTQWAGRQLMVGFTIPLTIFAGVAAKTFKDLEAQAINFKKVYGDIFTTNVEVERNLAAVKELSLELTKYGIAVKDTMELASIAAQSGLRGADLMAATTQATRLAVLGQMEQAEAMQTVISMQTAFQQSNEDLSESVDFLNIIENQTVLSLQDVAGAIPRVAPVIKGLGGDVKDLAVLLVAMREGGVSAAEGANALKNSLGRLIDPTKKAREMAEKFGISLDGIVIRNKGEVLPMIRELAKELQGLDGLEQQQLLSAIFGKFQYARIGALMKNIADDSSQAARAMALTGMSAEELARTAEEELAVVENAVSTKFTAAMERAKVAIAPVGEQFLKALTPIFNFISDLFEKFNNLPDGIKNAIAIVIGIIGGIAPVALMVIGLIGNLMANGIKFINVLRGLFARLRGNGQQFQYMAIAEQEAAMASASLEGRVGSLTGKLLMQQEAVAGLIRLYGQMAGAATNAAAAMPLGFAGPRVPKGGGTNPFARLNAPPPDFRGFFRGFNKGIIKVPGTGNKDTIPAFLTPGESVVTKEATQKYGPMLQAMNAGTIPGFSLGDTEIGLPGGRTVSFTSQQSQTMTQIIRRLEGFLRQDSSLDDRSRQRLENVITTQIRGQRLSIDRLVNIIRSANIPGVSVTSRPLRTDISTGVSSSPGGVGAERVREAAVRAGLLSPEQRILEERFAGRISSTQLQNLQRVQTAHIEPRLTPDGRKDYRDLTNLRAELGATNNYLNRIKASLIAIDNPLKATIAPAQLVAEIMKRTGMTQEQVQLELEKLKAGIAPADDSARRVARNFAIMDQKSSAQAMAAGQRKTMLGTEASKGYQAEAYRAVERSQIRRGAFVPGGVGVATFAQLQQRLGVPERAAAASSAQSRQSIERSARQEAQTRNRVVQQSTQDIAILARKGRSSPHPIVAQDAVQDATSYARNIRQTLMSMAPIKIPGGMIQGAPIDPRAQYKASQSAIRREAFNIREMERIGMTDTQILRQLRRLEESKKRQLAAQQKNAQLAQSSATLTQKTSESLSREQQQQVKKLNAQQHSEKIRAAILGTSDTARRTIGQRAKGFFVGGTDEMGRTRGQRLAGMGNTATMGLMGLSMAASFAGGALGEMAQKIMPVTMGLFALQMMLPMLKSPFGIAMIAVAALAASFIKARMDIDKAAKEASDLGANIGGVANQLQVIEEATGIVPLSSKDRLFRFDAKDKEAMAEFTEFFKGERGSKFVDDLRKMSAPERYQAVAKLLTTAIANGLEPERAQAFGQAIAEATGDYILNSKILADIRAGRIGGGSRALIDMARERMDLAPEILGAPQLGPATRLGGALGGGGGIGDAERFRQVAAGSGAAIGAVAGKVFEKVVVPKIAKALTARAAGAAIGAAVGSVVPGLGTAIGIAAGFGIGFAIDNLMTAGDREKITSATESAGQALGFSLQMLQDISNAEAVLAEERRLGKISIDEARRQEQELKGIRQEVTDYFIGLFGAGAETDIGALRQAMKKQLAYQGFTEQQQDLIIEDLDINKLAKTIFDAESYKDLNEQQKSFISTLYQNTLTGLTPENLNQRMADVEKVWRTVAQNYLDAINRGADPRELFTRVGLEEWAAGEFGPSSTEAEPEAAGRKGALRFNIENRRARLEELKKEREGQQRRMSQLASEQPFMDPFGGYSRTPEDINNDIQATRMNLMSIDYEIKQTQQTIDNFTNELAETDATVAESIGSSIVDGLKEVNDALEATGETAIITEEEFIGAASKFVDKEFLQNLLLAEGGVGQLADAVFKLRDFGRIDIELFLKKDGEDFDPEALKAELEKMGDTKFVFDPKIVGGKRAAKDLKQFFGSALPDPQEYANMMKAMGTTTDQFFSRYQDQAVKVGQTLLGIPDALNEKTGRIKPKMLVEVLTSLFGETIGNAQAVAKNLNSAFPDSLSPIQLMIMVGLEGPGVALLADPKIRAAIEGTKPGENVFIDKETRVEGKYFQYQERLNPAFVEQARVFYQSSSGGFNVPPAGEKEKTGGGGGGDKKDPIQELIDGIMDTVKKFTNLTKLITGKYKNAKNALQKALSDPNFGFSGGLADQMRKAGLNEKLIADILSKGAEEATKIWENFSKVTKKGSTVLAKAGKQANILSAAGGISQEIDKLQAKARADRERVTLSKWMEGQGFSKEEIKEILSSTDDALITQMFALGKNSKKWGEFIEAQKDAKKAGEDFNGTANTTTKALEAQSKVMDVVNADFAKQEADLRFEKYQEFAEIHGKTTQEMELEIAANERLIEGHKDRISAIQKEINALERKKSTTGNMAEMGLEQLQREIELNNQAIRALERKNELDQRRIDTLRRQDEIRNRVADALNHELEIMSQQEEKINKSYDERFKALDKVSKINDHLINQQKQQLGLSQAIAEGDIYAATAAAQEMRASSAQFARDQLRTGLETARDNQIEGLRTEGGLSREQAEEQIRQIKEQSYQVSLMIRDIEDEIYRRQQEEILPLKDKQFNLESAIQGINNEIYAQQQLILQIERDKIEPLEQTNEKLSRALKYHEEMVEEALKQQTVNGLTRGEWDLLNKKIVAGLEYSESLTAETEGARKAAAGLAKQWKEVAIQIDNAFKAAQGEFRDIEARDVGPGYTEAQRQADLAASAARRDKRIAEIVSGAPLLSLSDGTTNNNKSPSIKARSLSMPGGRLTVGEAFDQNIVYLGSAGRLRWSSNRQLVNGMPPGDLSQYAMGGKVKGYGKGGKMLRYPMGGLIPYALGGMVFGDGARDSVLAKLTPGEYVIRKAMVDKYGIPMLEALNQGAFSLPKYNVGNEAPTEVKASVNMANINAPVYNTYDMKFAVNGTNASADEIANKVMFKMKQVQSQGVRSNRAY